MTVVRLSSAQRAHTATVGSTWSCPEERDAWQVRDWGNKRKQAGRAQGVDRPTEKREAHLLVPDPLTCQSIGPRHDGIDLASSHDALWEGNR